MTGHLDDQLFAALPVARMRQLRQQQKQRRQLGSCCVASSKEHSSIIITMFFVFALFFLYKTDFNLPDLAHTAWMFATGAQRGHN